MILDRWTLVRIPLIYALQLYLYFFGEPNPSLVVFWLEIPCTMFCITIAADAVADNVMRRRRAKRDSSV